MRARTVIAALVITGAAFTAMGMHGNVYAPETAPLNRCIQSWINNTDTPCVTYETNRQTGAVEPIRLNPGQQLDD